MIPWWLAILIIVVAFAAGWASHEAYILERNAKEPTP